MASRLLNLFLHIQLFILVPIFINDTLLILKPYINKIANAPLTTPPVEDCIHPVAAKRHSNHGWLESAGY